jgi:hypothetical protein
MDYENGKSELIPTNSQSSHNPSELIPTNQPPYKTSESIPTYRVAREETMSATEEIVKVESELDERVKSLYGL